MMSVHFNREVSIPAGRIILRGDLVIPKNAHAIIIFAHGSGSSRCSNRNQVIAQFLQKRNFGTLLPDLLTMDEDINCPDRFDIDLLTERLTGVVEWLEKFPAAHNYPVGLFGAGTGAAAAIKTAAQLHGVYAMVSRGGRPDLVLNSLQLVKVPTLLIIGSLDYQLVTLNYKACRYLNCEKKLEVIQGATHLFEEKGAMKRVSELAADWFEESLPDATEPGKFKAIQSSTMR
ncbi:dienelactone hydrolase family protein [Ferruginibacter profundus]